MPEQMKFNYLNTSHEHDWILRLAIKFKGRRESPDLGIVQDDGSFTPFFFCQGLAGLLKVFVIC